MSQKITVQDLLEAGVHFGHQVKRWNPKMKEYVYGIRNGIYIIDITKTMQQLADACNYLQTVVYDGGDIIFVGTKRQAQEIIKEAAVNCGMYYVSDRWLGGILTNNSTIRKSISKMRAIDKEIEEGSSKMSKKELSSLSRKSEKIHRNLDGISDMRKLPAAIVVVDVCNEDIAVKEAKKLNIPVVGIVDTNGNPDTVDYPIAGNDDAIRSIRLLVSVISDSVKIAAELYQKKAAEEKAEKAKKKAEEALEESDKKAKEEKKQSRSTVPDKKKSTAKKLAPKEVAEKKTEGKKKTEDKKSGKAVPAAKKEKAK